MPAPDLESVKVTAQREWAQDAGLRAEFTSEGAYVAYCQAVARSVVGIGKPINVRVAGLDMAALEQDANQAWDSDRTLHAEFSSRETYIAWRRADAVGAGRVFVRRSAPSAADQPMPSGDTGAGSLAQRQAAIRQENVGRTFAGLAPLPMPQR